MKDQRKNLRDALLADEAIIAIIADRVYPNLAPKSVRRQDQPFITYELSSLSRPRTHDQVAGSGKKYADKMEFVVNLHGEDLDVLDTLFEAVDNCLHAYIDADRTSQFALDDVTDLCDYKADDSDDLIWQISMNFICFRRPAAAA